MTELSAIRNVLYFGSHPSTVIPNPPHLSNPPHIGEAQAFLDAIPADWHMFRKLARMHIAISMNPVNYNLIGKT